MGRTKRGQNAELNTPAPLEKRKRVTPSRWAGSDPGVKILNKKQVKTPAKKDISAKQNRQSKQRMKPAPGAAVESSDLIDQNVNTPKNGEEASLTIETENSDSDEDMEVNAGIQIASTVAGEKDLLIADLLQSQNTLRNEILELKQKLSTQVSPSTSKTPCVRESVSSPCDATQQLQGENNSLFKLPVSRFSVIGNGVDEVLKKKVADGKFIEMSEFLPWFAGKNKTQLNISVNPISGENTLVAQKPRFKLSITQWLEAFDVFIAVKADLNCSASIIKGLLQYRRNISQFSANSLIDWAGYDRHFRSVAAQAGIVVWDQVDNNLLLEYGGLRAMSAPSVAKTEPSSSTKTFYHCYRYNSEGKCPNFRCRYPHICSYCKGNHSASVCYSANKQPSWRQQRPTNSGYFGNANAQNNFAPRNPNASFPVRHNQHNFQNGGGGGKSFPKQNFHANSKQQ